MKSKLMSFSGLMRRSALAVPLATALLAVSGCAQVQHPPKAPAAVDDSAITSLIQTSFNDNQALKSACIRVESLYGVVLLSGITQNAQQKQKAQMLAERVTGVKAVHNDLVIASEYTTLPTEPNCRKASSFRI